jgi:hypothetical protein
MEKDSNRFLNAVSGYDTYFEYLLVIWTRFLQEFAQYDSCRRALDKFTPKSSGVHIWSARERRLHELELILLKQLRLDYESFVIFATVLMNKLARIAQLLIGRNTIPSHNSFSDHKKYFLKAANIPYSPKEDYAKLVREGTDWFDNFLKASRDKIMIHSDLPWTGIRRSPIRGIQFARDSTLSGVSLRDETEFMISLKQKYIEKYPELRQVADVLYEIIEFFMNHNIRLEDKDMAEFYTVLHKTGSTLPSLHHLASCIHNFIKEFSEAFEGYV